jgi:hypothetical protein
MSGFMKLEPVAGGSEWDVARAFVQNHLWPYYVVHEPGLQVDAHYHRTDEDLQLVRGSMTFVGVASGSAEGAELHGGDRMRIPEGVVHSVTIGPAGTAYVMGLKRPISLDQFSVSLPVSAEINADTLARLIEANYHVADAEEEGNLAKEFFEDLLSERFVFVPAVGTDSMQKSVFVQGLEQRKGRGRRGTDLRLHGEGLALVATMLVTTDDGGEYLNTRLFQRESDGKWRCVRWTNAQSNAPAQQRISEASPQADE